MPYKTVVVVRSPYDKHSEALARDVQSVLEKLEGQGLESVAITPIADDGGYTTSVLIAARSTT